MTALAYAVSSPFPGVSPIVRRKVNFIVPVSIFVMTIVHLTFRGNGISAVGGLYAAALFSLLAISVRIYLLSPVKWSPVLPVGLLQLYIFHGLAACWDTHLNTIWGKYPSNPATVEQAQLLALLGASMFFIGCVVVLRRAETRGPTKAVADAGQENLGVFPAYVVAWSVIAIGLRSLRIAVDVDLGSIQNILTTAFDMDFLSALLIVLERRQRNRVLTVYSRVYLLSAAAVGALSGMMEYMVRPLLIYLVASWLFGRRPNARVLTLIILAIVIYSPAKHLFRERTWRSSQETLDLGEVSATLVESVSDVWSSDKTHELSDDQESRSSKLRNRFSEVLSTAQIVDWVPSVVPHRSWAALEPVAVFAVPRFVWPGKPELTRLISGEYALTFGRSTAHGIGSTAYAITSVGEGYWAFGVWGVAIFLFALGLQMGVIARLVQSGGILAETIWILAPVTTLRLHSAATWMLIHNLRETLLQVVLCAFLMMLTKRRNT